MKGDTEFGGVLFFDYEKKKILEAGHTQTLNSREFTLGENERLLGIKMKMLGKPESNLSPRCEDL
jgi:hypothetical protein